MENASLDQKPAPNKALHALSLAPSALQDLLTGWGQPKFRAQQLTEWLYGKRTFTVGSMTNLPQALRSQLETELQWDLPEIVSRLDSADGASKLLLKSERGLIEAVILRYEGRTSLCVSSQVGCRLACSFCQTGRLGFVRHLSTAEILAQFAIAEQIVQPEGRRISHVVFMGMGEPLDNYDNVVAAVNRLTGKDAFGLSVRNVTVSTSGLAPQIRTLARDVQAALAISLHGARDELRTELMPINRRYPLAELKAALLDYQRMTGDKITIEYILIKDKNCGIREAKELVKFLHGMRAKVNLIPFNAHPGLPYQRPDDQEIRAFQVYLAERSIPAPVRYSKGLEVSAACGQLAAKSLETLGAAPKRQDVLNRGFTQT